MLISSPREIKKDYSPWIKSKCIRISIVVANICIAVRQIMTHSAARLYNPRQWEHLQIEINNITINNVNLLDH